MGCSQSKLATSESSHKAAMPTSNGRQNGPSTPITRDRIDSWAISNAHPDPAATIAQIPPRSPPLGSAVQQLASVPPLHRKSLPPQAVLHPTVESQWKFLWETHSMHLLDPADVHSVLDTLICKVINQLSPVEITLLQRRVRSTVRALATSSKPRAVFNAKTEIEAQTIVERYHLMNESVVAKILPASSIQRNAYLIMLHLSETLWDRVADVALLTAQKANLEMDVNKRTFPFRMPKPSVVPDVSPAEVPPGVTLQSMSFILALARNGSRRQQLVLLFYLLVDKLGEFLASHPAGGVPTWLLEVDQETVIGLASLTHYHYFGHGGALPVPNIRPPPFCASSSRQPLTIQKGKLRDLIQSTLCAPLTTAVASMEMADNDAAAATNSRRNSKTTQLRAPAQRRSSDGSNAENKQAADGLLESPYYPKTLLMKKMATARDQALGSDDSVSIPSSSLDKLSTVPEDDGSSSPRRKRKDDANAMTLQSFVEWADEGLSDTTLAMLMHRLVVKGILPTPELEKEMVQEKWHEWQALFDALTGNGKLDSLDTLTRNVTSLLNSSSASGMDEEKKMLVLSHSAWGGIAGIDGGGAMGYGVLYCIDKRWWEAWTSYVGWSALGERPIRPSTAKRPGLLATDILLENEEESVLRGTLGSYEHMKKGLKATVDYILVPPGVWDVLYELYGGGPPLPRIVKPLQRKVSDFNRTNSDIDDSVRGNPHPDDLDNIMEGLDRTGSGRVMRLPDNLSVALHPWIVHVHLCDPSQPYRRGDAGINSIRIMTMPDAPFWRLLAEVIIRFPLHPYKAFDADNRGKGRLWKKSEQKDVAASRYGPWNLLSKSRHAMVPFLTDAKELGEQYSSLIDNWKSYADNATVESIGLNDHDQVMFEFTILNRNSELVWPREAAAKAGKVRRLAEEDASFRAMLQGVDEKGNLLLKPVNLRGLAVDAMDATGRWYPVNILEADIIDEKADEVAGNGESSPGRRKTVTVSRKKVRVDFTEHGGHHEWIDVDSDRLAIQGRFTNEADDQTTDVKNVASNGATSSDAKVKPIPPVKKASAAENGPENGKICLWPGFGACGLTNLGNTCYSNSAIQCMSYLPVLRSYLLSAQYKATGDLNRDNPLGTGGKLLEEFAELMRMLWSGRTGEKSPSRFRAQLGKLNTQFAGADQQDAQEFLNYILDMLHEDSNRVRKKPSVEAVDDDWVKNTSLTRVGDETWRRFLRRNRSIMTDVAMGQVLNTVTCPVCNFTSKNFDPFNLLSIPIPTVADVVFQCTVLRRATAINCPWVLDRPRRGEKETRRYGLKQAQIPGNPPSETYIAEEYILPMSRLADLGDIKLKLQNVCGIPSHQLRLCRVDVVEGSNGNKTSVVSHHMKISALTDKEGPCSQLANKRAPDEKGVIPPTRIIAFESTLRSRPIPPPDQKDEALEDTADEDDELEMEDIQQLLPTPREKAEIDKYLKLYGDDQECRLVDTNPLVIAKAVSRSLWPGEEQELKLGLRVDAKDQRGNWFPGNVVEIVDGNGALDENGSRQPKRVRVHFDNFSSKWDELYGIEDFKDGRVRPLYAHSAPRPKPTEFIVQHRHTDRNSGRPVPFGQCFYIQCQNDWSNARAGAHILAQASRFLRQNYSLNGPVDTDDGSSASSEGKARRLYEKTQSVVSDLIDLLIDCDREYIRLALGVSDHNTEEQKKSPYRNPSFDPTSLSNSVTKKVGNIIHKLPFEIRVTTIDTMESDRSAGAVEEIPFPFSLIRTIGNYMNARHQVILHWREPPVDKTTGSFKSYMDSPVMYSGPAVVIDEASAREHMEKVKASQDNGSLARSGHAGIDLGVCLTEFCKVQSLAIADNWRCPHCKDFREGRQSMNLWRLPDLLTFHVKRFNMSARWREKITTKVNFPLTGLDMSDWFHGDSPMIQTEKGETYVYDLIGVVNHYGSMTGGHYIATCKASVCSRDGQEEVAYSFNGAGAAILEQEDDTDIPSGWRLGRQKTEVNQGKVAAAMASQAAVESAEPLWLQFDDEAVESIAPENVVSELAYVLFYRRRRMTPSNVAKYSTLD